MAFSFTSLRHTAVPLAGFATVAVLSSAPVYAQEVPVQAKKPIYDAPEPTHTPPPSAPTKPTPQDRLAEHIGTARRFINVHYRLGQERLDEAFSKYLAYESSITSTIASLAPPKDSGEQVVPGAIYVAVSTMAGAIAARNRIFPVRALTPLAVGVAAGWYFIPETMTNVGELMWYYEKKVPAVADAHLQTRTAVLDALKTTKQKTAEAREFVDVHVSQGRKALEELVKKG